MYFHIFNHVQHTYNLQKRSSYKFSVRHQAMSSYITCYSTLLATTITTESRLPLGLLRSFDDDDNAAAASSRRCQACGRVQSAATSCSCWASPCCTHQCRASSDPLGVGYRRALPSSPSPAAPDGPSPSPGTWPPFAAFPEHGRAARMLEELGCRRSRLNQNLSHCRRSRCCRIQYLNRCRWNQYPNCCCWSLGCRWLFHLRRAAEVPARSVTGRRRRRCQLLRPPLGP
uniref:Uncharacterized protein n=1 Tax=Triticum urartu TaxID=4572 RepID=A0A8R7UG93_TRIUA